MNWKAIIQIPTPTTADGCFPSVTTRWDNVCATNLYSVAHYPMGGYWR